LILRHHLIPVDFGDGYLLRRIIRRRLLGGTHRFWGAGLGDVIPGRDNFFADHYRFRLHLVGVVTAPQQQSNTDYIDQISHDHKISSPSFAG